MENEIATKIIESSINVHTILGPGLLESAYKECLYYEMVQNGLYVAKEKPMLLIFKDVKLDEFKLGLLMNFNTFRIKDGIKRVVNNL
ncbi:GxxExxY protein [Moheibacter stercoris]|uniref:GxxExxY protein n=1 Tax=Moheibacter stercoris TaxID=1628251 RepID=A0ABV2LW39_9FLAO